MAISVTQRRLVTPEAPEVNTHATIQQGRCGYFQLAGLLFLNSLCYQGFGTPHSVPKGIRGICEPRAGYSQVIQGMVASG